MLVHLSSTWSGSGPTPNWVRQTLTSQIWPFDCKRNSRQLQLDPLGIWLSQAHVLLPCNGFYLQWGILYWFSAICKETYTMYDYKLMPPTDLKPCFWHIGKSGDMWTFMSGLRNLHQVFGLQRGQRTKSCQNSGFTRSLNIIWNASIRF